MFLFCSYLSSYALAQAQALESWESFRYVAAIPQVELTSRCRPKGRSIGSIEAEPEGE